MSLTSPPLNRNEASLQLFNLLPQELLLSIFQVFDPIERSLLLPTCRNWRDFLLSHRSLWNSLVLTDQWSFEESLSILQLFNTRSAFQLKHVCLGAELSDDESLNEVFEELGKSTNLKVLSLVSEFSGDVIMRQAKKSSSKLNTLHLMSPTESHPALKVSAMFSRRKSMGIKDSEDDKLKYFRCKNFLSMTEEDEEYMSTLKGLCILYDCSLTDLTSLLMASQSTLTELDLLLWFPSSPPLSTSGKGKLCLGNLQILDLPLLQGALSSFKDVIEVEGKLDQLGGFLNSLIGFNFPAVRRLSLHLDIEELQSDFEEMDDLEQTVTLFEQYDSIEELTIGCPKTKTGGKKHLDFILKTLLSSQSKVLDDPDSFAYEEEENPGSQEGKETASSAQQEDSQPEIPLPNLVELTIKEPVNLDGHSLWKLWKIRKDIRDDFIVRIGDDVEDVEVNDWEARGWTH